MSVLCKHIYEKIQCRKYQEHCDLTDKDIHNSFKNSKKLFFRPLGGHFDIAKEDIKKYYGNKLYDFSLFRNTFIVEKKDNKVSFKYYHTHKQRNVGVHYFKTFKEVHYVTYNLRTNIVYSGKWGNRKNYRSVIRANDWRENTINSVFNITYQSIKNMSYNPTDSDLNDSQIFFDMVEVFFKEIVGDQYVDILREQKQRLDPTLVFLKNFLDKNKIVYPNNYVNFFNFRSGILLKDIRKNENNLLKTIENKHGITGKKYHRVLHQIKYFNHSSLKFFRQILTENELKMLSDIQLKKIFEYESINEEYVNTSKNMHDKFNEIITCSERKNMFECLKFIINDYSLMTFLDHIKFYVTLKVKYNVDVFWKSKTFDEFTKEHVYFSNKISECRQGNYTRTYPSLFYENIMKPLYGPQGGVCFPILFQKQQEFFDESFIQSNCVKTYVKTINSIIVSLRDGSIDSKERATIEYRLMFKNNKWSVTRVQSLGRFNKSLDSKWDFYLEELDNVVKTSLKFFDITQYKFQNDTIHNTIKYLVETNDFGTLHYKDPNFTNMNKDTIENFF